MKNKFKILFMDVLDPRVKFQSSYPHLGIGYLISYLRRDMQDTDIRVAAGDYVKHLTSFKPDMVAISSVTQNFGKAKQISNEIKRIDPSLPVIIGGIHISQIPGSLNNGMDIGVIGEGEETFLELVWHIRRNGLYAEGLDNIDGLTFWRDGETVITKEREAIADLDMIPHPNRKLLANRENQLLLTSRGCPYKCAFCASAHYWDKVRYFSAEYVLDEIGRIIKDYPVMNLFIFDDLFVFNKKRLAEISSGIIKHGYHKRINFWCTARANHIDEEAIVLLKSMKIKGVGMGLESGSDRILKMVKDNTVSVEINKKAIELCNKHGIFVHGSFMLGCPYETEEDMLKTYDFVRTCGIDKGDMTVATPLPGTGFWEYALKDKKVSLDMDWSKLAYRYTDDLPEMGNCILLSNEVSKERFLEIFNDIAAVLIDKRKEYDKKWGHIQGAEMKLTMVFSWLSLKKIIRDPARALRYAVSFLSSLPRRLSGLIPTVFNKPEGKA